MNKLRTLIYTILDGAEDRAATFFQEIEAMVRHTTNNLIDASQTAVHQVIRIVFDLIEVAVEGGFALVGAVVELVIGKRDENVIPTGLGTLYGYAIIEDGIDGRPNRNDFNQTHAEEEDN